MTIITVTAPAGRISLDQRRVLSVSLTDAVLVPEVGQAFVPARVGFQVHFKDLPADAMAIGGRLLSEIPPPSDVMVIDVAVMDAAWDRGVRTRVIVGLLEAMAQGLDLPTPSPTWWITFRTIDEGSWGSRGGALSILDLLASGAFTDARAAEIRAWAAR